MKALTLFLIVFGLLLPISSYSQNDNTDKLIKQNKQLRIHNENLKKKIVKLNTELKEKIVKNEQLTARLDSSVKSLNDSIVRFNKRIHGVRNYSEVAIKALQHRKKLLIIGFILLVVAGSIASFLVCKKYKKDTKKTEDKLKLLQAEVEEKLVKIKEEEKSDLKTATAMLEQKINELGNIIRQ